MQNVNWAELREAIDHTPKGGRSALVKQYAERLGVSKDTIYRNLRKRFGRKKTVTREKRIPQRLINEIARIKMYGMKMQIDEREYSTERCIDMLQKRGVPGAEALTVSSVNRRLVESGFRLRDPIVRVEASYVNQEHQMDFTRSKYFQLVGHDGKDWILKVSGRELHYKQDDRRLRLWIVSLVDTYSRIEAARGYAATSESQDLGLAHLNWCYNREPDDLLIGKLPEQFKTDQGSFGKTSTIKDVFARLGVETHFSKPYQKRGIQKVETKHRSRWQQFELGLALQLGAGQKITLGEYNELLFEECVRAQDLAHPVRQDTRRGLYLSSLIAHPPKKLDVDLREIAFKVWERKVRDTLTISIDNMQFACPENTQGKTLRIYRNKMGEFVAHVVEDFDKVFVLRPTRGFIELGEFEHRPHATYRQKVQTAVEKDLGQGKRLFMEPEDEKIKPKTVFDRAVETIKEFPNAYEAKKYIGKRLPDGQTYADYADVFDELLSQDLSVASVDAVLKAINQTIMQGAV